MQEENYVCSPKKHFFIWYLKSRLHQMKRSPLGLTIFIFSVWSDSLRLWKVKSPLLGSKVSDHITDLSSYLTVDIEYWTPWRCLGQ